MDEKIYQLGMEERYGALAISLWYEADKPCTLTFLKAKTEGLIIIELTNTELANKILTNTGCKVHIKDPKKTTPCEK